MKLSYDPHADALYLTLHGPIPEGGVAETVQLNERAFVDLNGEGDPIGIELCGVSTIEGMDAFARCALREFVGYETADQPS